MAAKKKKDEKKEEKKEEKESKKDVSKNVSKLVDEISKLSVMELSELVDTLKEELGVEATPMAAQPAASPAGGAEGEDQAEAGGAQTLVMTGAGDKKIQVIKALREINQNWGLKEAKEMTENLPAEILKEAKSEEVKEAADKLKEAGATVEMK